MSASRPRWALLNHLQGAYSFCFYFPTASKQLVIRMGFAPWLWAELKTVPTASPARHVPLIPSMQSIFGISNRVKLSPWIKTGSPADSSSLPAPPRPPIVFLSMSISPSKAAPSSARMFTRSANAAAGVWPRNIRSRRISSFPSPIRGPRPQWDIHRKAAFRLRWALSAATMLAGPLFLRLRICGTWGSS